MRVAFQNLFETNNFIVLAVYGQAYFVLGLAVALQWRRDSSLVLARTLPLLAAYGLCSAFVIWGDIFIPLQAYLASDVIRVLRILQCLLLLFSFGVLLQFGLQLNWNKPWAMRLPWLLAGVGGALLLAAALLGYDTALLRLRVEQAGRPLFVFPGAFLAAWGVRGQAERVELLGLPTYTVSWLRIAGISFGAIAIFGGLIVPITVDRATWLDMLFGVPAAVPRAIVGSTLAYAMIQSLRIFRHELQRMVAEMGRARALAADRQRIGRELHDGTIQALYGAGLMLENALHALYEEPEAAKRQIREVMQSLNQTIADIRRYIFDLSAGEDELAEALGQLANEFGGQTEMEIEYRIEGRIPQLRSTIRNHLLQMVREALSNAHKHSGGNKVTVLLRGDTTNLRILVVDDGRGLPPGGAFRPGGQGIPNLRARARLLNGDVSIRNQPNGGTTVEIKIPYDHVDGNRRTQTSSTSPATQVEN